MLFEQNMYMYINKTPPENLEYRPEFSGDILKKSETSRNFNFFNDFMSP